MNELEHLLDGLEERSERLRARAREVHELTPTHYWRGLGSTERLTLWRCSCGAAFVTDIAPGRNVTPDELDAHLELLALELDR